MAITYLTGIPRSGKSYYAVYKLYRFFIFKMPKRPSLVYFFFKLFYRYVPKSKRSIFLNKLYGFFGIKQKFYYVAYTNINQFDFSRSRSILKMDYDTIYAHIEILNIMHLEGKTDYELIEYAKSVNLYNCLFVIDECQNHFAKEDKVLTWWFTYHGHLHHDIILITQNLDLVHNAYFKIAEFYYKAVPPSSRFFSGQFRYIQYNSHKLFKNEKIGDFHVPMIPDIFNLYVSGASNNSKSQVKKYIIIFLILLVVVLFAFSQFLKLFDSGEDTNTTKKEDTNQTVQATVPLAQSPIPQQNKAPISHAQKVERDSTHDSLFVIHCVDMICTYKDTDFPKPLFNKLTQKIAPEFIWFFQSANYTQYFVMLPADTFDFLQIEEKKEKDATSKTTKTPNAITAITSHK